MADVRDRRPYAFNSRDLSESSREVIISSTMARVTLPNRRAIGQARCSPPAAPRLPAPILALLILTQVA